MVASLEAILEEEAEEADGVRWNAAIAVERLAEWNPEKISRQLLERMGSGKSRAWGTRPAIGLIPPRFALMRARVTLAWSDETLEIVEGGELVQFARESCAWAAGRPHLWTWDRSYSRRG